MLSPVKLTPDKTKQLSFYYYLIFALQLFLGLIFWGWLEFTKFNLNQIHRNYLKIIVLIINISALVIIKYSSGKKKSYSDKEIENREEAKHYFISKIKFMMFLAIMSLVNLMTYLLVNENILIIIYLIVMLWYYINKPKAFQKP